MDMFDAHTLYDHFISMYMIQVNCDRSHFMVRQHAVDNLFNADNMAIGLLISLWIKASLFLKQLTWFIRTSLLFCPWHPHMAYLHVQVLKLFTSFSFIPGMQANECPCSIYYLFIDIFSIACLVCSFHIFWAHLC